MDLESYSIYDENEDRLQLITASEERVDEIRELVNNAYSDFFKKYLTDDPKNVRLLNREHTIEIIKNEKIKFYTLINRNNEIVGTIGYVQNGKKKSAWFGLLSLRQDYQGRGINSKMIAVMEEKALQQGKTKMKLDVSGFATRLQESYKRHSYSKRIKNNIEKTIPFEKNIHWKLLPEYENDKNKNFVVMWKSLE